MLYFFARRKSWYIVLRLYMLFSGGNRGFFFSLFFFFSSRRRHTRCSRDWSSDVCSSDLLHGLGRQQGCGHRRQGGVLCAADGDAAFEAVSPFNGESVHEASSCWTCGSLSERAAQIVFRER